MKIDCSAYCPIFLKMLNSCPTRNIDILNPENINDNLFEIIMVILSTSPYVASFVFLTLTTYFRTVRGVVIIIMIFAQNFIIEFIKGSLRDPRPNFKCNKQFGNPSNHATFYTSLIIWLIMEFFILNKKFRFSNLFFKLLLIVSYPFIIYSRIYLNYHSIEQISNGIMLGVIIGFFWFLIVTKLILKTDNPLIRIFSKLDLKNNLSDDKFSQDEEEDSKIYNNLMNLITKKDELSGIKNTLKDFRENLDSLEFVKMEKEKQSKKDD